MYTFNNSAIAKLLFRTVSQNRNITSLLCNFKEQANLHFKVGTRILTCLSLSGFTFDGIIFSGICR